MAANLTTGKNRKFDRFRRLQEQVATISDDLDNQIMFAFLDLPPARKVRRFSLDSLLPAV